MKYISSFLVELGLFASIKGVDHQRYFHCRTSGAGLKLGYGVKEESL